MGVGADPAIGKQLRPYLQRAEGAPGCLLWGEGWRSIQVCNLSQSHALPMSSELYLSRCRTLLASGQEFVILSVCLELYIHIYEYV